MDEPRGNYLYSSNYSVRPKQPGFISQSNNFTSSMQSEMDTEQEAINMIRNQNRKIQDLYEQLEKKDMTLQSLQTQINSNENYKLQMENYKRQVGILEEKLRLYESDFSSKSCFLSEQLKSVSEAETKLRNQIITKDKIIHDMDQSLKDHERQLAALRKQILDKEGINSELKQDFNEITAKFKNLNLKLNVKEEEFKKVREENERRVVDLEREKSHLEDKLSQLIDIVKQYSKELSEYNLHINALENEKRAIQKANNRLLDELEEMNRQNKDLKIDLQNLKEVKNKLIETEGLINTLENKIENERIKNETLSRQSQEINDKYLNFKDKHSGENSLENLRGIINKNTSEIENLNLAIDNLTKQNKTAENKINNYENEIKDTINTLNSELKSIVQWIETYLSVYYDQNFEIPDLPLTISKTIKNKIKIEKLKETLQRSRKTINEEFYKYELNIKEIKNDNNELMVKQEKLFREISELKSEILNKNEEIFVLTNEIEVFHNTLNQAKTDLGKVRDDVNCQQENTNKFLEKIILIIQKEIDYLSQNENHKKILDFVLYKNNFSDSLKSSVEDYLDKLIQINASAFQEIESLDSKLREYTNYKLDNEKLKRELSEKSKSHKEDIEKLLRDKDETIRNLERGKIEESKSNENMISKNLEKMKSKLVEKEDIITQIQNENSLLKSQLEILEKNINNSSNLLFDKEKIDNLEESNKNLEKKIRNLTTDIELKEMQIKSQEQMLNRRTIELNEIKNKLTIEAEENFDKEKIINLENDKEKLLKDNLSLMNANYMLNNQVNILKTQLGQNNVKNF